MQDRPTAVELLEAVKGFLEKDVIPSLEGTKLFHARVAANVMSILAREWQLEDAQLAAEGARLATLLDAQVPSAESRQGQRDAVRALSEKLCERIRAGDADSGPWRAKVMAHVRATVEEKLAVANPKMLAAVSR